MKLGYSSKSLNNMIDSQSNELQTRIKDWWGKKLLIAYCLAGFSFAYGLAVGLFLPELLK